MSLREIVNAFLIYGEINDGENPVYREFFYDTLDRLMIYQKEVEHERTERRSPQIKERISQTMERE